MHGSILPLFQYAFRAWRLVKAYGQLYLLLYLFTLYLIEKFGHVNNAILFSFITGLSAGFLFLRTSYCCIKFMCPVPCM